MTFDHPIPLDTSAVPCRKDPELFFSQPDDSGRKQLTEARIAQAKKMCAGCPLKDPCLAYAIRYGVEGTWGGSTLRERNKFRDDNGLVAIPVVSSPYTMRAYQLRVDGAA